MGNPLPIVIAELRRGRAGAAAVVALIALAVALGVAVSAQDRALREGSARAADPFDLVIGAPGSETQLVLSTVYLQPASLALLDGEVLRALSQTEGVVYAAPIGFGDSFRGYPVVGSTAAFTTRGGTQPPPEGRPFQAIDEAVVGADVALAIGDRFAPLHGRMELEDSVAHGRFEFTVVGRLAASASPWDRAVVVPIEAVWRIHALPTGHRPATQNEPHDAEPHPIGPPWDGEFLPGVPAIVVKPKTFKDAYVLRSRYRRGGSSTAVFPAEVLVRLYGLLGDARTVLSVIAVATQTLIVCAVLLAVFAALASRRRQIAVLRALGASRGYLFFVVWCHVTLLIAAGACLGLALGWLGAQTLSGALTAKIAVGLPVSLTLKEVLMASALIVIGSLLAVIPALLAYRQSVSAGMRG